MTRVCIQNQQMQKFEVYAYIGLTGKKFGFRYPQNDCLPLFHQIYYHDAAHSTI